MGEGHKRGGRVRHGILSCLDSALRLLYSLSMCSKCRQFVIAELT
jgi:hypothetical protein